MISSFWWKVGICIGWYVPVFHLQISSHRLSLSLHIPRSHQSFKLEGTNADDRKKVMAKNKRLIREGIRIGGMNQRGSC